MLEIVGGILLYLASPSQINWLILLLTNYELSEDPGDVVANLLINWAQHLSIGTNYSVLITSFRMAS